MNALSKFSPTMDTLVGWKIFQTAVIFFFFFLRLSEIPDLSGKVFLITYKFSQLDYSKMFYDRIVNKTLLIFLFLLKYREILTVKNLKSKKKKLALILFYYASSEIWLGNSKKLIFIDRSKFNIFSHPQCLNTVFGVKHSV